MKVGDLVKYDKSLSGLENCMGVIVDNDGLAYVVQWVDRYTERPIHLPPHSEMSVELPEFLEVVSEG